MFCFKIIVLVLFFILNPVRLLAGWEIHELVTDNFGQNTNQIIYFQENKIKTIIGSEITIYNLNNSTICIADTGLGFYCNGTSIEYKQGMLDYFQNLIEDIKMNGNSQKKQSQIAYLEAAKQRWEQTDMSLTRTEVEVVKTDKTEVVNGYKTYQYELKIKNIIRFEYWISPDISISNEIDIDQMFDLMQKLTGGSSISGFESSPEYIQLMKMGYSMRTIDYDDDVVTVTKVVKVKRNSFSKSVFFIPQGIKQIGFEEYFKLKQIEF